MNISGFSGSDEVTDRRLTARPRHVDLTLGNEKRQIRLVTRLQPQRVHGSVRNLDARTTHLVGRARIKEAQQTRNALSLQACHSQRQI